MFERDAVGSSAAAATAPAFQSTNLTDPQPDRPVWDSGRTAPAPVQGERD